MEEHNGSRADLVHRAVVDSMRLPPPPPPPVGVRESALYWEELHACAHREKSRLQAENTELRAALERAEMKIREGDIMQRVQGIREQLGALPDERPGERGEGANSLLGARATKMLAAKRQAQRSCDSLLAAFRHYQSLHNQSDEDARRAARNAANQARHRDRTKAAQRAATTKVWPAVTTYPSEEHPPRLAPFHLIQTPVTVLEGIKYGGPGAVPDIERAAAEAVSAMTGVVIGTCFGFGRAAYAGKGNRGCNELHMHPDVLDDKIDRALAAVRDSSEQPPIIEEMLVHVQIHTSSKGEGWRTYRRAIRAWAATGGLLLFRAHKKARTFDALFVHAADLKPIAANDTQQPFTAFLGELDEATREYMYGYLTYYAHLLHRRQTTLVGGAGGADGPAATRNAQQWVGAMRDRVVMCAQNAVLQPAVDVYKRLAQLADRGDVALPGLAPIPNPTAPTVRKVIKDGLGWWVQGRAQNEVVLRRSRGPEDQTPPEMVGEAPRKRGRR
jgi:hypothetical protein